MNFVLLCEFHMPNLQPERERLNSFHRVHFEQVYLLPAVAARASCGCHMTSANKVKAPQNSINKILSAYGGRQDEQDEEEAQTHFHFHFQRCLYDTVRHRARHSRGGGGERGYCGTYFKFKADIENILIKILLPFCCVVAKATEDGSGSSSRSCR